MGAGFIREQRQTKQAIGTGVIGGMITATLAVVFVPVFFVVVMKLVRRKAA